jgi:hypothetical protein
MTTDHSQEIVRTGLALMDAPGTWVEAHPRVPVESGDVGGDIQAGPAWGRRFIFWHQGEPGAGVFVVADVCHYQAATAYGMDPPDWPDGESRDRWIVRQTELTICTDYADPGGTEQYADCVDVDLPYCPCCCAAPLADLDDVALMLTDQLANIDKLPDRRDLWERAKAHLT